MKILLVAVNFLFASYSYAQSSAIILEDNSTCANGNMAKVEAISANRSYEFSKDLETMTVTLNQDTEATTETFTLTAYGKNTYMAIPVSDSSTVREFFVQTDESLQSVQMFAKDDGGTLCGGGLVVTQIQNFKFTELALESKGG